MSIVYGSTRRLTRGLAAGLVCLVWIASADGRAQAQLPDANKRGLDEAQRLMTEAGEHTKQGHFDAALPRITRALELREGILGPDDPLVGDSLHALAVYYDNKGDYRQAEPVNQRALAIREKALGPDHPDVAATLYNLAWIYLVRQDYARAEKTYQRVLAIQEQAFGPNSREMTSTLNDLAILYHRQGDYDKAVDIDERVVAIRERVFGPDDAGVAKTLSNLGLDYIKKGDFASAEARLVRAVKICEKALGPDHPDNALALNNLAIVYSDKGDYPSAEPLILRALAIDEKAKGSDHPDVANELTNLAWLYQHERRYDEAKPLYLRALAIREKAFGPNHTEVGDALNNLASLYLESHEAQDEVEGLLRRGQDIVDRTLGPESERAAYSLTSLGRYYFDRRDYEQARVQLLHAVAIREKTVGVDHPTLAENLRSLAKLYRATGDRAQALAFWTRYSDTVERNLERNLPIGSERQKLSYLKLFDDDIDNILSFQAESPSSDQKAIELAMTTLLRRKGRALDAMTSDIGLLRSRANPSDQALFGELAEARAKLAAATLRGPERGDPAKHRERLAGLGAEVEQLERSVGGRSAEFRARSAPISLASVRAALPPAAVLVEFARYTPKTADGTAAAPRYTGYLLFKDRGIQVVDLGAAEAVDRTIDQWRQTLRDPHRSDVRRLARRLDQQIVQPLRAGLASSTQLLVSPDGSLNLVPFAALVDENGRFLVERYSITYLTSGRDLLRLQVPRPSQTDAVVVADPAFGDLPVVATTTRSDAGSRFDDTQVFFGPLPGVVAEVRALREFLPTATFLTKEQATKAELLAVKGPRILHVATHGFFLQDPDDVFAAPAPAGADATRLARAVGHVDNPLLRSGLALAGANRGGNGGASTGVMTALEAADLDLWGTRLVVLSACDTGVGEVRNGDGVYGLRRALVLAGSESQMMSLWPVSDRGTRDVVVAYYQTLLRGSGRGEALRQAQLRMIRDRARSHPYYWAGFILSGQWAGLDSQP